MVVGADGISRGGRVRVISAGGRVGVFGALAIGAQRTSVVQSSAVAGI